MAKLILRRTLNFGPDIEGDATLEVSPTKAIFTMSNKLFVHGKFARKRDVLEGTARTGTVKADVKCMLAKQSNGYWSMWGAWKEDPCLPDFPPTKTEDFFGDNLEEQAKGQRILI